MFTNKIEIHKIKDSLYEQKSQGKYTRPKVGKSAAANIMPLRHVALTDHFSDCSRPRPLQYSLKESGANPDV